MRLHLGGRRRRRGGATRGVPSAPGLVLLVVDDGGGAGAVRRVAGQLASPDWTVHVVGGVTETALAGGRVDGVVLSLDGVDDAGAVCSALRAAGDPFVLAVTASPSSQDCIRVLDAGADEYLATTIPGPELRLRVRNLLRHRAEAGDRHRGDSAAQPDATAR